MKYIKTFEQFVNESMSMTGDYNDDDFGNNKLKYAKTPEMKVAIQLLKSLTSKKFSAYDLEKTIKKCKFKSMNQFKSIARLGGLEIEGLGNVDNDGNGDFEVLNSNYTSDGAAIAFFNDKFYRVG